MNYKEHQELVETITKQVTENVSKEMDEKLKNIQSEVEQNQQEKMDDLKKTLDQVFSKWN